MPSLPELLLHELDMLQQGHLSAPENEKHRDLAASDIFLNARLLANAAPGNTGADLLANAPAETLDAVIWQAAASTCFARLSNTRLRFMKQLYLQSVLAANLAGALAERVLPASSDKALLVQQAGFCGMFLNIGALVLDQAFPNRYLDLLQQAADSRELLAAETREFGIDHARLGAALLQRWRVEGFCCDAVRYHHHAHDEILDATPLVKLAWLANQLADEKQHPEAAAWAETLFAIKAEALESVRDAAAARLQSLSRAGNIAFTTTRYLPLPGKEEDETVLKQERVAFKNLRDRVEADNLLRAASNALAAADSPAAFATALGFAVRLLHAPCEALLFDVNDAGDALTCIAGTPAGARTSQLSIRCEAKRSIIADSYLAGEAKFRLPTEGLSVIDRQVCSLLGADNFCCEPVGRGGNGSIAGVLVLGIPLHQSDGYKKKVSLRKALASELGLILARREQGENAENDLTADYEQRIRETIHEVNNPLGIIKNYLQLLSMKQGDDTKVQSEISFIKSEIDRVSHILEKLKSPGGREGARNTVDINAVVTSLTGLFSGSLAADRKVRLVTRLDNALPEITCSEDPIRQIITNLVKNAAEALHDGGTITIRTAGNIYMNGEKYIRLSVSDDGPGIAPEILDNLFAPGHSTKGGKHTGSGLAIVGNLVKHLRGQISCQTRERINNDDKAGKDSCGTEFTVLLPMMPTTGSTGGAPL